MVVLWHYLGYLLQANGLLRRGENGVRKWVRNFRFCPPHVSVEALLPTAATDSLRACVVEHGFLVETKVLASCPSLESGSLRSYDDILRRITERQATAAELNTKQFPGHPA